MNIIIKGSPQSGKSTLLKNFAVGKKHVFILPHSLKGRFWSEYVNESTELIGLDEVSFNKEWDYDTVMPLLQTNELVVNRKYDNPIVLNKPLIVVTTQSIDTDLFEKLCAIPNTIIIDLDAMKSSNICNNCNN